jgi:GNAT superfamily N-acetyltransferase
VGAGDGRRRETLTPSERASFPRDGGWDTPRVLSVRAAEPADAAEIAHVHVRSWQVAYRGLLPDAFLASLRPEDRAARYMLGPARSGRATTTVAVDDGVIRGFATTGPARGEPSSDVGELLALYIDPDHWGDGAGRLLIADARARLSEHGFTEAILWVLVGNERAERFYRADGWTFDGTRREEELGGATVAELRYRRTLP